MYYKEYFKKVGGEFSLPFLLWVGAYEKDAGSQNKIGDE